MSSPGQLAYEAYERACAGDPGYVPFPWERVDRRGRKNWEAAAQAANREILARHDIYGSALEVIAERERPDSAKIAREAIEEGRSVSP